MNRDTLKNIIVGEKLEIKIPDPHPYDNNKYHSKEVRVIRVMAAQLRRTHDMLFKVNYKKPYEMCVVTRLR